jgi:hypothetical protein
MSKLACHFERLKLGHLLPLASVTARPVALKCALRPASCSRFVE